MINRLTTPSGLYNLGSGKGRTFLDLVTSTFNSMGLSLISQFIDTPEDIRDTYQYFTEADLNKLRRLDTMRSSLHLEDGIENTYGILMM